jgi:hypothetical protein
MKNISGITELETAVGTVPVDSKRRAGVELPSVMPAPGGHRVEARVIIQREGSVKPVGVVDTVSIVVA